MIRDLYLFAGAILGANANCTSVQSVFPSVITKLAVQAGYYSRVDKADNESGL